MWEIITNSQDKVVGNQYCSFQPTVIFAVFYTVSTVLESKVSISSTTSTPSHYKSNQISSMKAITNKKWYAHPIRKTSAVSN